MDDSVRDKTAGKEVIGSDNVIVKEARSIKVFPDHVEEEVRNVLLHMGAEEQADTLDKEEVAIVMELQK